MVNIPVFILLIKKLANPSFPSRLKGKPVNIDPSVKLKKKKFRIIERIKEIIKEKIKYCFVAGFMLSYM